MTDSTRRCLICGETFPVGKANPPAYLPFCSKRCRMVDLGRWLDGDYRVPGRSVLSDVPDGFPEDEGP